MKSAIRPILIIVGGIVLAAVLVLTGPEVEPRESVTLAPLVRVVETHPASRQLVVETRGTVVPRTESELVPEISGTIVWISPSLVSGGFFSADEPLLRIDPRDYDSSLEQAHAARARAESEWADAKADRDRQLDLAKRNVASAAARDDAINRFRVANAGLREARAALDRAERDRERAEIVAPYDGRVRTERIDVGQFVNRGSSVATLYAVDFAEVRLPIPDEQLAFLDLPLLRRDAETKSTAAVVLKARFAGAEHEWRGEVVRTEGEIDARTRMVNVVARFADPYGGTSGRPPLSVGLFVEAEIYGTTVDDVVSLPRSALRRGNRLLLVDDDQRLHYRTVDVVRITKDEVVVAGMKPGERVCISTLASPIDGMRVRIAPSASTPSPSAGAAS